MALFSWPGQPWNAVSTNSALALLLQTRPIATRGVLNAMMAATNAMASVLWLRGLWGLR